MKCLICDAISGKVYTLVEKSLQTISNNNWHKLDNFWKSYIVNCVYITYGNCPESHTHTHTHTHTHQKRSPQYYNLIN